MVIDSLLHAANYLVYVCDRRFCFAYFRFTFRNFLHDEMTLISGSDRRESSIRRLNLSSLIVRFRRDLKTLSLKLIRLQTERYVHQYQYPNVHMLSDVSDIHLTCNCAFRARLASFLQRNFTFFYPFKRQNRDAWKLAFHRFLLRSILLILFSSSFATSFPLHLFIATR
jgi:hypothetical protein